MFAGSIESSRRYVQITISDISNTFSLIEDRISKVDGALPTLKKIERIFKEDLSQNMSASAVMAHRTLTNKDLMDMATKIKHDFSEKMKRHCWLVTIFLKIFRKEAEVENTFKSILSFYHYEEKITSTSSPQAKPQATTLCSLPCDVLTQVICNFLSIRSLLNLGSVKNRFLFRAMESSILERAQMVGYNEDVPTPAWAKKYLRHLTKSFAEFSDIFTEHFTQYRIIDKVPTTLLSNIDTSFFVESRYAGHTFCFIPEYAMYRVRKLPFEELKIVTERLSKALVFYCSNRFRKPAPDEKNIMKIVAFVALGADINFRRNVGALDAMTPLFASIISRFGVKVVSFLLHLGAKVNYLGCLYGRLTPLHEAVLQSRSDITDLLLRNGADPSIEDDSGYIPLHFADRLVRYHSEAITSLIPKEGRGINWLNSSGMTPLHSATRSGLHKIVEVFVKNNADPNILDSRFGMSPFHFAIRKGHVKVVKFLIDSGKTDLVLKSKYRCYSPLHFAADPVCNVTLDSEYDMDKFAGPPDSVSAEITMLLLAHGDTINIIDDKDETGRTALYIASYYGRPKVIKALLEKGADIDVISDSGQTAHDVAGNFFKNPQVRSNIQRILENRRKAKKPVVKKSKP